ncbi:MAG: hypothetical protein LN417_07980 [Candidatus Thermoplasmatota archaeon]|nr:hypothetical protein [Candidatus Thermoplasmatota archaeon]
MHEESVSDQYIWKRLFGPGHIRTFALSCIIILQVSLLLVLVKTYTRVPLHIPGHSALLMLPILILGKLGARWKYSGTGIGLTSGVFAVGFGIMGGPFLAFSRLLIMGVMVDVVFSRSDHLSLLPFLLCGALANVTKVLVGWTVASAVGIPVFFIQAGMTFSVTTHIFFGVLGGLAAFGVARALAGAKRRVARDQ